MKLSQSKTDDAIVKLQDFTAKVMSMLNAAKPNISSGDADLLIIGANAVIACLST
ncbi:MAG: hypothetical protein OEQ53_21035 [Saprospiraceae bacterium]|nr:hypothetical protein [Saprospiraceae bacterium]